MRPFFFCLVCICVSVSSGPAVAAPNADSMSQQARTERARNYFTLGETSFKLGDYDAAIENFRRGYDLVPQPLFLYNIANSARRAGKLELAKESYERYLREVGKPAERKEIQRRIDEIDAELAARPAPVAPSAPEPTPPPAAATPPAAAASTVAASPPPVEPSHAGRTKTIAGFTVAGVGVAVLASGGALLGLAAAANEQLAHPAQGWVFDPSVEDRRNRFAPAGIALLVGGGALVVAGVTVGTLGLRESARARR